MADTPPLAPLERRLGALGLDALVLAPFFLAFLVVLAALNGFEPLPDPALLLAATALVAIALIAYFAYFDGSKGATPGKRRLGLAVVDEASGERIGWQRGIGRRAAFILCQGFWPLFGYVLIDKRRRALHDRAVGSLVIDRRPAELGAR